MLAFTKRKKKITKNKKKNNKTFSIIYEYEEWMKKKLNKIINNFAEENNWQNIKLYVKQEIQY